MTQNTRVYSSPDPYLIAFWNFIKKMAENSFPAVVWDCCREELKPRQ